VIDYITYFQLSNSKESRGIGSMLGLGIADALGASTEFIPFVKNRHNLIEKGFVEIPEKIREDILNHRGQVGIWTDDCSMSLCLADSILAKNNGGRPHSIGLGGNISISMS
jgi:ADP-ribosylglycohydrolase